MESKKWEKRMYYLKFEKCKIIFEFPWLIRKERKWDEYIVIIDRDIVFACGHCEWIDNMNVIDFK